MNTSDLTVLTPLEEKRWTNPHMPTDWQTFLLRMFDRITPERIASILGTTADTVIRAAEEMESWGVTNSRLVLNRAVRRDMKKKRLLNIDDAIDKTGVQLIAIVPEDKLLRKAGVEGIYQPYQLSFEAFFNLAARIEGRQVPLAFL